MDRELLDIIAKIDYYSLKRFIHEGGDVSEVLLSLVIEQTLDLDDDIFWDDADDRENAINILQKLDDSKAVFVECLLQNHVSIDDDALISCYTFRCPNTARVLLEYGANPNVKWGGFESCIGMAGSGLHYIGLNKASEVLVKEYISILKEFGGIYLNFDYACVYYDDWQMQCCGEPFHVGGNIELLVEVDKYNSKWHCTLHEEHHYTEQRQYILKGKVEKIEVEIIRPPHDAETRIDTLREYSELIPVTYADGYSEIPNDCKFLGYVISFVDYTVENIKPVMDIFIGIQASGKSSYARTSKYHDYVHINLDTLKTRFQERQAISTALRGRKNIVIDNTNPSRRERTYYIGEAKKFGYKVVCHFFQSILKDCIERNSLRDTSVPIAALVDTSRRLELPAKEDGFNEMYFVRISGEHYEESEWIEEENYEI